MSSMTLKSMNFRGWETLVNRQAGYAPYFSAMLRRRVMTKRATNVVITGEPGVGKSYQAIDLCRVLEGLTASDQDRFKLDQVVFRFREYMQLILTLRMGKAILFDEPSYAMGKRDWYKDVNKVLVQTIESQRFKVHPVFLPIVNKALLDKTIRSYLIQFQVHVTDRGRAIVYRIYPAQHSEKVYRYTLCNLDYAMFDADKCTRDSCLGCALLNPSDPAEACQLFRARYERKKASIQDERYEQALDTAQTKESKEMTDEQIAKMVYDLRDQYCDADGKIDVDLLRIIATRTLHVKIGHNKAYTVAKLLKLDYPDSFA